MLRPWLYYVLCAFSSPRGGGNSTPGGSNDVLLLQDGTSGILLQDGTSFFQLQ